MYTEINQLSRYNFQIIHQYQALQLLEEKKDQVSK